MYIWIRNISEIFLSFEIVNETFIFLMTMDVNHVYIWSVSYSMVNRLYTSQILKT